MLSVDFFTVIFLVALKVEAFPGTWMALLSIFLKNC
jgi:hypothetical protein